MVCPPVCMWCGGVFNKHPRYHRGEYDPRYKATWGGKYIADFRYDEGIRVREEFISPTLTKSVRDREDSLSTTIFLIEVKEDGVETDPDTCGKE